jgi:hypothetical protein
MLFVLAKTVYQLMAIHLEEDDQMVLRLAVGDDGEGAQVEAH